jgi:hypothetical protein
MTGERDKILDILTKLRTANRNLSQRLGSLTPLGEAHVILNTLENNGFAVHEITLTVSQALEALEIALDSMFGQEACMDRKIAEGPETNFTRELNGSSMFALPRYDELYETIGEQLLRTARENMSRGN